jgi:toxin ParE1/3/4
VTRARYERREAHQELLEQARYYEREREGLGLNFLDAVDAAVNAIDDFPAASRRYPSWDREPVVRVKQIEGFPVGIVYIVEDGSLVIFAYAHHRRNAGYWLPRTSD